MPRVVKYLEAHRARARKALSRQLQAQVVNPRERYLDRGSRMRQLEGDLTGSELLDHLLSVGGAEIRVERGVLGSAREVYKERERAGRHQADRQRRDPLGRVQALPEPGQVAEEFCQAIHASPLSLHLRLE